MKSSLPSTRNQANRQLVMDPQPFDILCGKDRLCTTHVGSKRFRTIIESYRHRYSLTKTKYEKMTITKEIYEMLQGERCRFLKYNSSLQAWEELSPTAARDKVGHALRFANRAKRRNSSESGSAASNENSSLEDNAATGVTMERTEAHAPQYPERKVPSNRVPQFQCSTPPPLHRSQGSQQGSQQRWNTDQLMAAEGCGDLTPTASFATDEVICGFEAATAFDDYGKSPSNPPPLGTTNTTTTRERGDCRRNAGTLGSMVQDFAAEWDPYVKPPRP